VVGSGLGTVKHRSRRPFLQAGADPDALPLLALVCVFCRDPQLRASFALIESLKPGEVLARPRMEAHLASVFPERFSPIMLAGLATR